MLEAGLNGASVGVARDLSVGVAERGDGVDREARVAGVERVAGIEKPNVSASTPFSPRAAGEVGRRTGDKAPL